MEDTLDYATRFVTDALGANYEQRASPTDEATWFAPCADIAGCGPVVRVMHKPNGMVVWIDFSAVVPPSYGTERDLLTLLGWAVRSGYEVDFDRQTKPIGY